MSERTETEQKRYEAKRAEMKKLFDDAREANSLRSRNSELVEGIKKYGRHRRNCGLDHVAQNPCNCGWHEFLASLLTPDPATTNSKENANGTQ